MIVASEHDLEALKRIGKIVASALVEMEKAVEPDLTTGELDAIGARVLEQYGARSAPQLVYGFPGVFCISVNDEIVHGIPGPRRIKTGDLIKIDATAELDGYIADATVTVPVPPITKRQQQLISCTEAALRRALEVARVGRRVCDIGRAIENEVKGRRFSIVPALGGHEVGRTIHEELTIPNYFDVRDCQPLQEGLVLAIEPIVATGAGRIKNAGDGWTILTADGSMTAHFEHTIVITQGEPIVLTARDESKHG